MSWKLIDEFLVNYLPQAPGLSSSSNPPAASLSKLVSSNGLSTFSASNSGYSKAVSAPSITYFRWSNSTSPASTGNLGPFNSINYSESLGIAPTVSIGNLSSLNSKFTGTASKSNSSSYTAIVSASNPGLPSSFSNSSSSNGSLGNPGSKSGSTNSKPTNLVNTYGFSSIWPTSASGASLGASSQSRFSASVQSASPGSSNSAGSAPLTTLAPLTGSQGPSPTSTNGLSSDTVTSTDTVEPSNASTESSTNSAWTENFWLTTRKDGHTTVVPVIVGCPGCGGKGRGVILWNFPSLPRVSFQFPKLPGLPAISFPCIPIPLIKTCSSPPKSEFSFRFRMFRTLILRRRRVWRG